MGPESCLGRHICSDHSNLELAIGGHINAEGTGGVKDGSGVKDDREILFCLD